MKKLPPKSKKSPVHLNEEQLKKAQKFFDLPNNSEKSSKLFPVKYSRKDSKLPYSIWKIYNPETEKFDFYQPLAGRIGTTREYGLLGEGGFGKVKKIKKVYDGQTQQLLTNQNPNVIKIQKIVDRNKLAIAQNEIKHLDILKKHIMSGRVINKRGQTKIVSVMPMFVGEKLFDIIN
ncbi:MAG: hypothetical protein ACR2HS_06175, partial [Gammaproteobacteria bacterium]